ncbi:MAG: 16S rRNA (uracil(1498)-N(3))-methyltransferase [Sulfurimonadaceae bacterium]|nr:16S rRNA (uracil(1498)-N(3))-methyltransferase [Sulfurimonadaceae bacterium]
MTYVFDEDAGKPDLLIKGESYKYLIKVRRHIAGDMLAFRSPKNSESLHLYKIVSVDGRQARLELSESRSERVEHNHNLHIGWCVIDGKSVEKVLPLLNELGVAKITFIQAERSQKNFKPDFKRYERILMSSMQQCGRSTMMEFETAESVEQFLKTNPDTVVFDFCDQVFDAAKPRPETVVIGPEGGFSDTERALFEPGNVYRLDTPMILRSETAAVALSSKILL